MKFTLIILICLLSYSNFGFAEDTKTEKAKTNLSNAGRKAKKVIYRSKEVMCGILTGDSKLECLAQKSQIQG